MASWKTAMGRLEGQLLVPYAKTKPLPEAFEGARGDPGRWSARLQQGVTALAQLRAGAAFLRAGTRGEGPNRRPDRCCVICPNARGARRAEAIPEESVVHVVGNCPGLAAPRPRYLQQRAKQTRPPKAAPTPDEITM